MGLTVIVTIVTVICTYILPFVLLYARHRWLIRQGGLFGYAHKMRNGRPGVGRVLGFARYRGDRLDWYRTFSLVLRSSHSFSRAGTSWQRCHVATALEGVVLFDNS